MKDIKTEYIYKFGNYPTNNLDLIKDVTNSASDLEKKLTKLEVNDLMISDYNKRYFGEYIKNKQKRLLHLTKYSFLLISLLSKSKIKKKNYIFVDHGGGHGILSLLAKQYGIGFVIHNDIFEDSSKDAKIIAEKINLKADAYITGEIIDINEYCNKNNLKVNGLASYDVIEHIYDIYKFFDELSILNSKNFNIVMASAANGRNPIINRRLMKLHLNFEIYDRAEKFGRKPTDTTKAIFDLRKKIISQYQPNLSNTILDKIALNTRGKIIEEIKYAVDQYVKNKVIPRPIKHPTNTCDPYTGNWFENILDQSELVSYLNKKDFNAKILPGYYDFPSDYLKKYIKILVNFFISKLGNKGVLLSPYYVVEATKND